MNTPVSFDVKMLLIEKGMPLHHTVKYADDHKTIKEFIIHDKPTIADVVMWIFEKHHIWIRVSSMDGKVFFFDIWCYGKEPNTALTKEAQIIMDDGVDFKSPMAAYIDAIQYTLKNLI